MAADGERGRSRALDRPRWGLFLGLAASIVVADQLVKAWIVGPGAFVVGRPVSIVGDLVRITLTHNQGALFGLFQGSAPIFALVSLAVLGIILWYHARAGQSLLVSVALGLLLGGAVGNLLDRLRLGYVVDFVDAGIDGWRWYTFNVADAAISTAILLLILLVHPSPGHDTGTLVNALLGRAAANGMAGADAKPELGSIGGVLRPGIVHRLDRDTSGLLMVAKNDAAQASLQAQLKARRVKKTYLALVHGNVAAALGRIEAPIGRDPKHRMRMAVVPDGRASTTGYRVRERFPEWTLLEVDLVTGRTHQIRVHLAAIGHPVAGDPIYGTGRSRRGPEGLGRMFLHAWRIELNAPSDGHLIRAEADLPPELAGVLDDLRARRSTA